MSVVKKFLVCELDEDVRHEPDGWDTKTVMHTKLKYNQYGTKFDTEEEAEEYVMKELDKEGLGWSDLVILPIYTKEW